MIRRNYGDNDYQAVCDFFIALNQDRKNHINWNWARFEWMMKHPGFDASLRSKFGLWIEEEKVVGAAIYDMYLGEAFCAALPGHSSLYPEILEYAWNELRDDNGLGVSICDDSLEEIKMAKRLDFAQAEQTETIVSLPLDKEFVVELPEGYSFYELDPQKETYEFAWLLWQGFDHGSDVKEFEENEHIKPGQDVGWTNRPHFKVELSLSIVDPTGKKVAYCCLWYDEATDYAYVEPVCVIPSCRKMHLGKAMLYEAFNRAYHMGAKKAYVISDQEFYKRLGFCAEKRFTFYWKKENICYVNDVPYEVGKLLGKGKGGYSYFAKRDNQEVVLKQIHHEPCSYYQFGNKIEAEQADYRHLLQALIRIPKMLDIDVARERIVKELLPGETIFDMVAKDVSIIDYLPQVEEMARQAKEAGLNIDYYPTNFMVKDGLLYYVDYECNPYMEQWSFENWGKKYWSKTPEFLAALEKEKK